MKTILHTSDFHINIDEEKSKKRLRKLADTLKKSKIEIDFLVFSGDIIDAKTITIICENKMKQKYSEYFSDKHENENFVDQMKRNEKAKDLVEEYNALIRKETLKAYEKAVEIFSDFIEQLEIKDMERVIICCGNHDRLRLVSLNKEKFVCDNEMINENDIESDFEYFDMFCKKLKLKNTHKTFFHSVDGINFIILNTNWKIPNGGRNNEMCINCGKIKEIMSIHNKELSLNKKNNFLVAHKPFDDVCAEAKYNYRSDYAGKPIIKEIYQNVETMLFGDKHSDSVDIMSERKVFLSGSPLSTDTITYNLIYFEKDRGVVNTDYVRWYQTEWKKVIVDKILDQVYAVSRDYIKPISFEILVGKAQVVDNGQNAINAVAEAERTRNLRYASLMFGACMRSRESDEKRVDIYKENIFSWLAEIVQNTEGCHSINVKGRTGVGKSAFLGIVYLYFLSLYCNGKFSYIPFYFNLEYEISRGNVQGDIGTSAKAVEVYKKSCEKFESFYKKCREISNGSNLPICLIIDGLDEKNSLSKNNVETIEKYVYGYIKTNISEEDKYILSFNLHLFPGMLPSGEECRNADKVVFFNSVDATLFRKGNEEFKILLTSYLNLKNICDDEKIQNIIANTFKYRKTSISMNFLHSNLEILSDIKKNDDSWKVLEQYKNTLDDKVDKMFKEKGTKEKAIKVAYLLYEEGMTFEEINEQMNAKSRITFKDFSIIKNKAEIGEFLVAKYYVEELQKYAGKKEKIEENSVLYSFLSREVAIMIRLLLIGKQDIISKFICKHEGEIKGYLYSMLLYLAGHSKDGNEKKEIEKILKIKNDKKEFFKRCNQRSEYLAKTVCGEEDHSSLKYIYELMNNEELRIFNRCYQMYYYGDRDEGFSLKNQALDCTKDIIRKGFDFHNTFLVLTAKLNYAYKEQKRYNLMEFDLFTLCDLVYSRLQHRETDGGDISLFYSKLYNMEGRSLVVDILQEMMNLLNEYLTQMVIYNPALGESNQVCIYFKMMLDEFKRVSQILYDCTGKDVNETFVSPVIEFEKILKLKKMCRVGWEIPHSRMLTEIERTALMNKSIHEETIMEHVIETVYIALIFLPDILKDKSGKPYKEYDKNTIIKLILTREFGKIFTCDYTPFSEDIVKHKENDMKYRLKMLNMGAVDGFANLNALYELFEAEVDNGDKVGEKNLVISRELAIIQMEYKYYTLLSDKKIHFDDKRNAEFKTEFTRISTDICKMIQKKLIYDNERFHKFLTGETNYLLEERNC